MAEKEVITRWFHEYSDDILNFLIYYTGCVEVDDMVQEVFIKALNRIDTFNELSRPKTWLFSIARNVAIDEIRKWKREKNKIEKVGSYKEQKGTQSPEEIYQLNETNRELYRIIKTLKQSHRDVLILRGIKELNIKETAAVLHWSENKVKVTYHRALKALEKKLGGLPDE
ncbi:RNA polymerase sigma factor [Virgibacillus litoralis]|uniref:RNA polymerase sigma-70 factor (ECF subfamily) n=1 Tax=Virgibacillus litoralis TaxID=578221 RepID=A0ABS4H9U4_9BACI|nr:RNA polymerase sigma factor [Virgibacillus litoralis]MBP1947207.1 RNA polymerase sigma-70 factor (ECF subfamily) [Virgibacillus litoralis]